MVRADVDQVGHFASGTSSKVGRWMISARFHGQISVGHLADDEVLLDEATARVAHVTAES